MRILSREQVPSVPIELLNGKPRGFHHLGVINKTLGTPLNNRNGGIIVEKLDNVNKEKRGLIWIHITANIFILLQIISWNVYVGNFR